MFFSRGFGCMDEVDYESLCVALCTLLDRIDLAAEDPDGVAELCRQRFEIVRAHGLAVEVLGMSSGELQ